MKLFNNSCYSKHCYIHSGNKKHKNRIIVKPINLFFVQNLKVHPKNIGVFDFYQPLTYVGF